jgi:hypothetical protein
MATKPKGQHHLSFSTSPADFDIICKIVDPAWRIPWLRKSYASRTDLCMDVTAVHANGNPLRLEALLAADDFNFAHDMSGICNCLDRNTGQLMRGFSPRFSQPQAA